MESKKFDIIIVGAGPVGLFLAAILSEQKLKICFIDKQSKQQLSDPVYDGREFALTRFSWRVLETAGILGPEEKELAAPLRAAAVIDGDSSYRLNFEARELDLDQLAWMLSNHIVRKSAYKVVEKQETISFMYGREVLSVEEESSCRRVICDDGTCLEAPLVVAADSRFSVVRKLMGIRANHKDFKRMAIVSRFKHEKDLEQRALECFDYGHTVAVLPLKESLCSVVLTVSPEKAKELLALDDASFTKAVTPWAEKYTGTIELVSQRYSYPLIGVYAKSFYRRRFALLGDAAVGMHPVTAHGFNLGISGAVFLGREILAAVRKGEDIGSAKLLRRYHDFHYRRTKPFYMATNLLVDLYSRTGPVSKLARKTMLVLGNKVKFARRGILQSLSE
jgi:ubiquinone biosynthesis UbiH/UbiF/VisC/COQ6 family hydroxylase